MRSIGVLLSLLIGVSVAASADDVKPTAVDSITAIDLGALDAPINQCIRDNAAKVEAAVPNLNEAVGFLVDHICAEAVAAKNAAMSRAQHAQTAAYWQKLCEKQKMEKAKGGGDKSRVGIDYCSMDGVGFAGVETYSGDVAPPYAGSASPSAVALASRLLLDLRLSRKPTER
ncbi:MAG: hypothetical protein KGJ78_12860 [Alphaproteobacteria bacterium]|nr:hypothetical protein [Alphaproteobacteria bacterium]